MCDQDIKKVLIQHDGPVKDRGRAYCPYCGFYVVGIGKVKKCPKCKNPIRWE